MPDKWYQCVNCGAVFNTIDNLKAHREIRSGGDQPLPEDPDTSHVCRNCGQIFGSATALGAHFIKCNTYKG